MVLKGMFLKSDHVTVYYFSSTLLTGRSSFSSQQLVLNIYSTLNWEKSEKMLPAETNILSVYGCDPLKPCSILCSVAWIPDVCFRMTDGVQYKNYILKCLNFITVRMKYLENRYTACSQFLERARLSLEVLFTFG